MTVIDILAPETAVDPNPTWESLRTESPLYFHEAMNAYVISRYDDVERAFKDKVFTNEQLRLAARAGARRARSCR